MTLLALLCMLFGLFALRVPIWISLLASSLLFLTIFGPVSSEVVTQRFIAGLDSFPLLAVPLFMLTGALMNHGGLTDRMIAFAKALVGHLRGGLAQVNVVSSVMMGGVSGAAAADASAMGSIMIPAMKRQGYTPAFSAGLTGSSALIAPILPPSIPMILYATTANVSVGAMFLAGIVPGVLLGLALMVTVFLLARKRNFPKSARASLRTVVLTGGKGFLGLVIPVLIVGGIRIGLFTPTEAAAMGALYALVVGGVVFRELSVAALPRLLLDTVVASSAVLLIVGAAAAFGWILVLEQAPIQLLEALTPLVDSPWVLLLVLNLSFLILGMFMESLAVVILVTPILLPTITLAGIDPVHFGVIMVFNLMVGTLTPPVGVVMFIVNRIAGIGMGEFMRANIPFFLVLAVVLLLLTFLPVLSLWLPQALG